MLTASPGRVSGYDASPLGPVSTPPPRHPQPCCPGESRGPRRPTPPRAAALSSKAVGAMSVRKGQEWGAQARSPRGAASICRTGWLPWSQRHRRAAPVSGLLPAASATARTPPGLWRACPGPSTHCHRSRDAPVTEAAPTLATALEMPPDCEWSPRSAEQRGHGRWTALSPHGLES